MRVRLHVVVALALLCAASLHAQAWISPARTGSVTLTLQRFWVLDHTDFKGHSLTDVDGSRIDLGKIRSNSAIAAIDYSLTDRLAVTIAVPYVSAVYHGNDPESDIDDGHYHGTVQDLGFDLRYAVVAEPVLLTPFIRYSFPERNYSFFGHTAAGRHLREITAGFFAARDLSPFAPDVSLQMRAAYSRPQSVGGMKLDSASMGLDGAYVLTSHVSVIGSASWTRGFGGLDLPKDLDDPKHADHIEEIFHAHDRLARANYLYAGGGLSWRAKPAVEIFAGVVHTVRSENAHKGNGVLLGTRWAFGSGHALVDHALTAR
jgi:hypothetical protein